MSQMKRIHLSRYISVFTIIWLLLLWLPSSAFAHARLTATDPAADARLSEPPERILLEFNQKLEKLSKDALSVKDSEGRDIAGGPAVIAEDGKSVNIPVNLDLASGEYTVTYEVLSLDGHVVKGSYHFTVLAEAPQENPTVPQSVDPQPAADPAPGSSPDAVQEPQEPILASDEQVERPTVAERLSGLDSGDFAKVVFFLAFLPLVGMVLWGVILRSGTDEQKKRHRQWIVQLVRVYFLVLIIAAAEFIYSTAGFEELTRVRTAMLETTAGLAWTSLLILAVIGIFLLGKALLFDIAWLIAVIAMKTQIGHAAAADERMASSLMTGIHLLAASLWTGGLLLIVLICRRDRYEAERLLPLFSGASLVSFVLLALSGFVNSAIYLPDLGYLLDSRWGLLLLGKLVLVAVVVATAWVIRRKFHLSGFSRVRGWMKLDLALLVLIAAFAGLLTSSEPVPHNEPLHWHVMGEEVHMSADISPLSTGMNNYGVTVWLSEESGEPKKVDIRLLPGKTGNESVTVSLAKNLGTTDLAFDGFAEFHYHASGQEIDRPGWWRLNVVVTDDKGQDWEYRQLVKIW